MRPERRQRVQTFTRRVVVPNWALTTCKFGRQRFFETL